MKNRELRVCQFCVMDESDPHIVFFDDGSCSHCRHAARYASHSSSSRYPLDQVVHLIREIASTSAKSTYDCIVGLSGGVDSSWLLHLLANAGLNIYVHHVDTGWNTPKAVSNIYRICDKLSLKLHSHVLDWNLFRKIQQAYFYLGVINQDVPQDIGIFSSQINACKQNAITCLASGANNTTESILPAAWGHHWHDITNLHSIYTSFWNQDLHGFPFAEYSDIAAYRLSHTPRLNIRTVNVLDLISYSKSEALDTLKEIYNYEEYPHKHGESSWTLYYQSIYLPSVYGVDKRRAHLSNLIVNRDISREMALDKLSQPTLDHATRMELANFVSLKLGIPLKHALDPVSYVLSCRHNAFSATKEVIDFYTSRYYQANHDQRDTIFLDYLRAYQRCSSQAEHLR